MRAFSVTIWMNTNGPVREEIHKYVRYSAKDLSYIHNRLTEEAFIKYPDARRVEIETINEEV